MKFPRARAVARRVALRGADPEDLLHDAVVRVLRSPSPELTDAKVARATRHAAIDALRAANARKRRLQAEYAEALRAAISRPSRPDDALSLRDALASLRGAPLRAVVAECGGPPVAGRAALSRARRQVREAML